MFSSTTMASSTTKPVAMVSAISDRLSSEKPSRNITPSVPSSETVTATLGISDRPAVPQEERDHGRPPAAMAISSVRSTSRSEARIVLVRSTATLISMSCGSAACSAGSRAFTPSTVAMMLAPGWRLTVTTIAGEVTGLPFDLGRRPEVADVLDAVGDLGDVRQPHRRAVALGDHQRRVVGRLGPGVVGVDLQPRAPSSITPFGRLALAEASAARTSSSADAVVRQRAAG